MSKAGSSLAAFLLSVPVSAILLMAVFGVPRFAPGIGGQGGEGGWQDPRQFFAGLTGNRDDGELFNDYDSQRRSRDDSDPFAGRRGSDDQDAPQWGNASTNSRHRHEDEERPGREEHRRPNESDWPLRGRNASSGSPADRLAMNDPPRNSGTEAQRFPAERSIAPSAAELTWTMARRRLAELGIQQFHLEPGHGADSFLFVCMFAPGDDPRVTRRFEAEAADPLAAVQEVLTQIDAWLEGRFSERSGQVADPSGNSFGGFRTTF